ncbi:hypothetical protein SprV_1002816000 [Sparganum proliferum]
MVSKGGRFPSDCTCRSGNELQKSSNGFTHLLTCVDRYTRWAEAIPLPNTQAETIVKAFVSRWVAMFGAPSTVTTDRGAQFESALFQTLLNFLGCTRIRTIAYHPAANGMVERFHRQLKTALRAVEDPGNWSHNLPLALLGIRAALKSDLGCSAAELVFGTTLRLPGEMITATSRGADETPDNLVHRLRQFMRSLSPFPPRTPMTESYFEKDLDKCTHVFVRCDRVRQPLEPPYDGPFRIISRGTKNFRIKRGSREEVVSVDRLKAAVPDTPPDDPCGPIPPAQPPRPSIPPSRILALPPYPPPTTPTTPSSTNNTLPASHTHCTPVPPVYITRSGRHTPTTPSAPLRATFGLAGGYCGSSRLFALRLCHAAFLSASHSLSIRCWDARGMSLPSRVLEANQRCPLPDWLADAETTKARLFAVWTKGVKFNAKVRARPYNLPAPSPTSGSLDSLLTPGPGEGGEDSTARQLPIATAADAAVVAANENGCVENSLGHNRVEGSGRRRSRTPPPTTGSPNARTARKAREIQGYPDHIEWQNFFAAIYCPPAKCIAPLLGANGKTPLTGKTQIL